MSTAQPTPPPVIESSPPTPRAVVFVDAQNLFHDAKRAFAYDYPNFNIVKLANTVCEKKGWAVSEIRFYTGVPTEAQNKKLKLFWDRKIFEMRREGVEVISRKLKDREVSIMLYRGVSVFTRSPSGDDSYALAPLDDPWVTNRGYVLDAGTRIEQEVFTEKGIDVSIAVDSIRYALQEKFEVCLFFSQDTDLDPAVKEIKEIGRSKGLKFILASAYPSKGDGFGIPGTEPIKIDKSTYDKCIDHRDFFTKKSSR
jgi:uncharacterized LabA/DUF88 family protein